MLSGCGFRLRPQSDLSLHPVYVQAGALSEIKQALEERLSYTKHLSTTAENARVIVHIISEERDRTTISYSAAAQAREFQLTYQVSFAITAPSQQHDFSKTQTAKLKRSLVKDDFSALAKEHEEALLFEDMTHQMADHIVRALASLPVHPLE